MVELPTIVSIIRIKGTIMTTYVVSIDLGTSGIKIGIFDQDLNNIESRYWNAKPLTKESTNPTANIDQFYLDILHHIKEILELSQLAPAAIAAIAVSGQMGGVIGVDADFRSCTGFDIGIDIRSERYNQRLHDILTDSLYTTTCGSPRNTPKILWWKETHPSVYKQVRKFIPLNAYIAGRFAGNTADEAVIDHTLLSFFGNEDLRDLDWSEEITRTLNLDLDKFPKVVSPFTRIGTLAAETARLCGLQTGTPIIAGAGDQAAGLLGAGVNEAGRSIEVSGSTVLLFTSTDSFIPDTSGNIMYIPSVFPGLYYACSYINGAGLDISWFKNIVAPEKSNSSFFADITEKAKLLPAGSDRLLFSPYFGGRQCPYDADLRGGWLGLTWEHSPEHMYRAILESIAYTYAQELSNQKGLLDHETTMLFSSGGGSKDMLWNSIKADVLGLPIIQIPDHDSSLLGAGIIALRGSGIEVDLQKIELSYHSGKSITEPDPRQHQRYRAYCELFNELYAAPLGQIFSRLSALS